MPVGEVADPPLALSSDVAQHGILIARSCFQEHSDIVGARFQNVAFIHGRVIVDPTGDGMAFVDDAHLESLVRSSMAGKPAPEGPAVVGLWPEVPPGPQARRVVLGEQPVASPHILDDGLFLFLRHPP